jgi:hypothetical protein
MLRKTINPACCTMDCTQIVINCWSPWKERIGSTPAGYHTSIEADVTHINTSAAHTSTNSHLALCRYIREGGWVFLDNVHLMQGWIPRLERKLEIAAETAHPDFRCFFSAEPINGAPQVPCTGRASCEPLALYKCFFAAWTVNMIVSTAACAIQEQHIILSTMLLL